jgi:hypothetical protein
MSNKPLTPAQRAYEERRARRQELEDEKDKQALLEIRLKNQRLTNEIEIAQHAEQIITSVSLLLSGNIVLRQTDHNTFQFQPVK